jgi:hypothetical protein
VTKSPSETVAGHCRVVTRQTPVATEDDSGLDNSGKDSSSALALLAGLDGFEQSPPAGPRRGPSSSTASTVCARSTAIMWNTLIDVLEGGRGLRLLGRGRPGPFEWLARGSRRAGSRHALWPCRVWPSASPVHGRRGSWRRSSGGFRPGGRSPRRFPGSRLLSASAISLFEAGKAAARRARSRLRWRRSMNCSALREKRIAPALGGGEAEDVGCGVLEDVARDGEPSGGSLVLRGLVGPPEQDVGVAGPKLLAAGAGAQHRWGRLARHDRHGSGSRRARTGRDRCAVQGFDDARPRPVSMSASTRTSLTPRRPAMSLPVRLAGGVDAVDEDRCR